MVSRSIKMTYREELNQKKKELQQLQRWINAICLNLSEGELSLGDLVAEEESLSNRLDELKDLMKEIVDLRQYIELEELGKAVGVF